jgi:hypothetical protein
MKRGTGEIAKNGYCRGEEWEERSQGAPMLTTETLMWWDTENK